MNEAERCPKCNGKMISDELERKCSKCGYKECIEPEYCPPKQERRERT